MNYKKKLVSVVMSVYNDELTIEKSIESIINQTYKELELLILDDASSDESLKIINKYKNKYKFIKVFKNEKNKGLTYSLNKLIKDSEGEYIARQDSDDESMPNRIMEQITAVEKNNLDFCSSRALVKNSNKKIPGISYYLPIRKVMKVKNPFIHGTLFIKRKVLDEVGLYDEKFYYAQDYKLMSDLLHRKYKYKIINKPLYLLNMENNISTTKRKEQAYFANLVKKNKEL
tara:strand:+ start:2735 stop:3424 length:690 start_codon:yes stop_codon:yes gene_type:complete